MIYGVGVSEGGKFLRSDVTEDSKRKFSTVEYRTWYNMLLRCFDEDYHIKKPTYIGCSVSENFKNFQWFAEWCNNQVGFKSKFHLDKDLLVPRNKVYSEENCVFLPPVINAFLLKNQALRGDTPIGVNYHITQQMYKVRCGDGYGKRVNLGSYTCVEEAFNVYKRHKESLAKRLAEEYKNVIDPRAYEALMNYEVKIDD